jgi:hypothetical protein
LPESGSAYLSARQAEMDALIQAIRGSVTVGKVTTLPVSAEAAGKASTVLSDGAQQVPAGQ